MSEMVKYIEENGENIITSNKKNSLVSVPSRYNISHSEEAYENNSRNLLTKSL